MMYGGDREFGEGQEPRDAHVSEKGEGLIKEWTVVDSPAKMSNSRSGDSGGEDGGGLFYFV